jgi:uncharacterized membrane protein YedE/YeeE
MAQIAVAFAVGIIFALGLAVSEMINPARVIGFLDVAGRWDPTLLLVMAGALAVTAPIFPVILSRSKPILAAQFSLPTKTRGGSAPNNRRRDFRRGLGTGGFLSRTGIGGSSLGITKCDSICDSDACGAMVGIALRNAITGVLQNWIVNCL